MLSGIDIGISDDYAVLEIDKVGTFYFGYESARPEDEDCEWRFTFTTEDDKEICSLTLSDIGIEDEYSEDQPAEVLLCGIGHCFKKGWIQIGDI